MLYPKWTIQNGFSINELLSKMKNLKCLNYPIKGEFELNGIENLKNLEELNVSTFKFDATNQERLLQLNKLKKLNLNVSEVAPDIGNLHLLEELELKGSEIALPPSFYQLQNLKKLTLSGLKLKTLDEEFNNLNQLEELTISKSGIEELSFNFKYLKKLKIQETNLKNLNADLSKCPNLTEIELALNKFKEIPESIGQVKSLKKLVFKNFLEEYVEGRKYAIPNDSQFTKIPKSFSNLSNLEHLDFSFNQMDKNLYNQVLQLISELTNSLKTVQLKSCGITGLDEDIWEEIDLEYLDLSLNKIRSISTGFYKSGVNHLLIANKNRAGGSTELKNPSQKYIAGLMSNQLDEKYVLKNGDLVKMVQQNFYRNIKHKLVGLAFKQNKKRALEELENETLANYFFEQKKYDKAIEYYTRHLNGNFNPDIDLAQRKSSYIDAELINYLFALAANGDNKILKDKLDPLFHNLTSAVSDQEYIDKCIRQGDTPLYSEFVYVSLLYDYLKDDSRTKECHDYASNIVSYGVNQENLEAIGSLNLLEFFLVAEKYDEFDELYSNMLMARNQDQRWQSLTSYLKVTKDLIHENSDDAELRILENSLEKSPIFTWSTNFVDFWLLLKKPEKQAQILKLNRMIQPYLF